MPKTLPSPRPRRPVVVPVADDLEKAEAFVTGGTSAPSALEPLKAPSTPVIQVSKRKLVARSDGRPVRRLVAYFDPTLAKRLERYAVDAETDVSHAIVEAVRMMLGEG